LFDERFLKKANEMLEEFKQKNPIIPKNVKVYISKNTTLNAYCLPDGTFVLHMGLFYWLKNEDQIAAILAHEISHKLLEHSLKTQVKFYEDLNSKESKKAIKTIKKEKYNKGAKALEMVKSKMYANRDLSRKHEYEADSLAYILLKNTKYTKSEIKETFRLMHIYDSIRPKGLKKDIYPKVFNLPKLPFKEEWLKVEDFTSYNYDLYKPRFNKDSLSTHPEIEERMKKLDKNFPELKSYQTIEMSNDYKKLNKLAEYNIVPNLMFFEQYGNAIYVCLDNIQKENDIPYYSKLLGENFQKIYQARKEYKLNRYLDAIDPKEHSESYIQFLSFMWNLELEEINQIAMHYNTKN
jgi:hypothetical protein